MKKILLSIIVISSTFLFNNNLLAVCNDDELNTWAEDVEIKYTTFTRYLHDENYNLVDVGGYNYAYLLSLEPSRKDIIMKATYTYDGESETLEAKDIPGYNLYAIGNYTNLKEISYKINIYGAKNSKCPNELLKVLDYSLEPFNFYSKTAYCEKYPEAELCHVFKDTADISEKEFNEVMKKYDEEHTPPVKETTLETIINYIREYGIYIVVPFLIITLVYIIKIEEYKKKEKKK